jgi:4-phospho-D-threonate 3-dehydrogenase / 4-phospho-D-erythronate 3-dehydrogenase
MSVNRPNRPAIGITMGDAAGIGPEIVLRALEQEALRTSFRCIIIGDLHRLRRVAAAERTGTQLVPFDTATSPSPDVIEVADLKNLPNEFEIGRDAPATGRASAEYLISAVQLWKDGVIEAIATAPISKKAIALGGYDYPGHTEFLAELTNTEEFAMSFFADKLRVVLLSTHLPLLTAIRSITEQSLINLMCFTNREIGRLLNREISIAVAGLNPHASEGGLFGSEENDIIAPAIQKCRDSGINVSGPFSPDTIFIRASEGAFDACIALYHDQATIAVKALSFGSGVNVTLGLPLIRTSVDHGTAYDIVGSGKADPSSMLAAIELAGKLVQGTAS